MTAILLLMLGVAMGVLICLTSILVFTEANAALKSEELYAIGMESATAQRLMPQLCADLGYQFPPSPNKILE